jgi:hypothetical protein
MIRWSSTLLFSFPGQSFWSTSYYQDLLDLRIDSESGTRSQYTKSAPHSCASITILEPYGRPIELRLSREHKQWQRNWEKSGVIFIIQIF